MEELVDRSTYLERVGIHNSTLSEWIAEGVVTPRFGPGSRHLFTAADVMLGRRISALSKKYPGRYSREQLVEIANGDRELDDHHSPPGAPDVK